MNDKAAPHDDLETAILTGDTGRASQILNEVAQSDSMIFEAYRLAVWKSNTALLQWLWSRAPDWLDQPHQTPAGPSRLKYFLQLAIRRGCLDVVRLLVDDFGADVTSPHPSWENSPVGAAVLSGNSDLVRWLLERGALPDAINGNRPIPDALCDAGRVGNLEMVRALVEGGSQVNGYNSFWQTPLDSASVDEVRFFLRQLGAKHSWELQGQEEPIGKPSDGHSLGRHLFKSEGATGLVPCYRGTLPTGGPLAIYATPIWLVDPSHVFEHEADTQYDEDGDFLIRQALGREGLMLVTEGLSNIPFDPPKVGQNNSADLRHVELYAVASADWSLRPEDFASLSENWLLRAVLAIATRLAEARTFSGNQVFEVSAEVPSPIQHIPFDHYFVTAQDASYGIGMWDRADDIRVRMCGVYPVYSTDLKHLEAYGPGWMLMQLTDPPRSRDWAAEIGRSPLPDVPSKLC